MKTPLLVLFDLVYLAIFFVCYAPALATAGAIIAWAWNPQHCLSLLWVIPLAIAGFIFIFGLTLRTLRFLLPKPKPGLHELQSREVKFWGLQLFVQKAVYVPGLIYFFTSSRILRTWIYRSLGMKIAFDADTASSVTFMDPSLISIGGGSVVGVHSAISGHYSFGGKLVLKEVLIGRNVMLGAETKIFPGTVIEDGARFAAKTVTGPDAIVASGAKIGQGVQILHGARVGRDAKVGRYAIIDAGSSVPDGAEVKPFSVWKEKA